MKLFEFAYFPDYQGNIETLANRAKKENWDLWIPGDRQVLHNYLHRTFERIDQEGKILFHNDMVFFNTGLFDNYLNSLYFAFHKNLIPNRQEWYCAGIYNNYQLIRDFGLSTLPERANYFENPGDLVYNTRFELAIQYDHILGDEENIKRLPASLRFDRTAAIKTLEGAVTYAKQLVEEDYKIAIPQFYRGKLQLLLPLYLTDRQNPDLALVVEKNANGTAYFASTCLTLEMAYLDARLIARPTGSTNWLNNRSTEINNR